MRDVSIDPHREYPGCPQDRPITRPVLCTATKIARILDRARGAQLRNMIPDQIVVRKRGRQCDPGNR